MKKRQGENELDQEKSPDKDKCIGIQNSSYCYTLTNVEKGPNHASLRPDSVARDDSRIMNGNTWQTITTVTQKIKRDGYKDLPRDRHKLTDDNFNTYNTDNGSKKS